MSLEIMEKMNYILSVGGVLAFLGTAVLLYDLKVKRSLATLVSKWGMLLALFITILATAITLVYSEVFGLIPCGLCWLERMALYPQIILIVVALRFKDKLMPQHGIALSVFGLVVAAYHHYIQMGGSEFIKCPVAGADCAKRYIFEFGFMTFPLLAVALFAFLVALYLYIRKVNPASSTRSED